MQHFTGSFPRIFLVSVIAAGLPGCGAVATTASIASAGVSVASTGVSVATTAGSAAVSGAGMAVSAGTRALVPDRMERGPQGDGDGIGAGRYR